MAKLSLFLIEQNESNGYDTFDSAIVAAENEEEARQTHPSGDNSDFGKYHGSWCKSPDGVTASLVGVASKTCVKGVILSSFNAG